jgi:hypothetical protein
MMFVNLCIVDLVFLIGRGLYKLEGKMRKRGSKMKVSRVLRV